MSVWQEKLPHSETWLVGVEGRLDQALNTKLEETLNELLEDGHYQLIVDLTQTTYINSATSAEVPPETLNAIVAKVREIRSSIIA